jgi:lipopolysaccharide biosynthesis glycosyltransferase
MNSSNLTSSSYYYLIVADLLPNDLSKCIYLDLDICFCKDLTELFNIDIEDNYIAGVVDPKY